MKINLTILCLLVLTGCAVVPTDGWPKLTWYWSASAQQHREELRQEKERNAAYFKSAGTNDLDKSVDTIERLKAQRHNE